MISNRLLMTVAQAEGYMPRPYYDTLGVLTIGYGWALEKNDLPQHIADALLKWKLNQGYVSLNAMLGDDFLVLSELRQEVLVEMVYQLGAAGVSRFKKMLAAIAVQDYRLAAEEMIDSRWAKQTPGRAARLAENMRHG